MNTFVGVDIGGSKTDVLVFDETAQLLGERQSPTETRSTAVFLARVLATIDDALAAAAVPLANVTAIGVGVPGQVDPDHGVVKFAANLNLRAFPLAASLSEALPAPIYLENDVTVGALDAWRRLGEREKVDNLAYVNIGTGLAAGLILNGQLYRGQNGLAGEIGHMILPGITERCACGAIGCLETVAAAPALLRFVNATLPGDPNSLLTHTQPLTVAAVFAAAAQGDVIAQQAIDRLGGFIALGLQNLLMAYDVARIVLGGGLSRAGDALLKPILAEWARLRRDSPLAANILSPEKIVLTPPGHKSGAWGAMWLARDRFLAAPRVHSTRQPPEAVRE